MLLDNELSGKVIGACVEVHRCVGPGLLESAYNACLARELSLRGLSYEQEKPLPVEYKGVGLEQAYRLDFVVEGRLILEVKAVERLLPIHEAQLITYLRLATIQVGLLVNFHTRRLTAGIRRFTLKPNRLPPSSSPSAAPCSNRRHVA